MNEDKDLLNLYG